LLEVSTTTYQKLRVYLSLIAARLDYSQNLITMPQDSWVACRQEYDQLVSLLLDNRGYVIQDVLSEEYNDMEEREPSKAGDRVALPGSLIGIFENIDNEASPLFRITSTHY
jgi:translation initiation factor 3 subunit C